MAQPKFSSIVLTWGAPQEPNGVIISYEVTYRDSDGNLNTINTTDLRFTIPSLTPGINVTDITVGAYTAVGQGEIRGIVYVMTLLEPCEYCEGLGIIVEDRLKIWGLTSGANAQSSALIHKASTHALGCVAG